MDRVLRGRQAEEGLGHGWRRSQLCDAPAGRGGTWTDDDTIIFTPTNGSNTPLMRVPPAGGTPSVFGTLSEGAKRQRWPQALPGGKVLYTENSSAAGGWEGANLVFAPIEGGAAKVVVRGSSFGRYFPSGHLIYLLMILPMEGDASRGLSPGKPTVFLGTPSTEVWPTFSPDGRWIAYQSNEAGSGFDVYVRPFPGPGGKWRISTGGGAFPRWSATSHELLFVSQGKVMAAPYAVVGESFRAEKPEVWSPTGFVGLGTACPYDLHPDGKRLAIIADKGEIAGALQDKVVFFFNFGDYLKKIAPRTK